MNLEIFIRVGIKPPKGILLYGPPGTGKTMLALAVASNIKVNFLQAAASSIIISYFGESARLIREMFNYARDHQPGIIFMDEIDAIGVRRLGEEGMTSDREIQRTLLELLNQLDGFDQLGKVKFIMATNKPDVLDPALLQPGRIDSTHVPNDPQIEVLDSAQVQNELSNEILDDDQQNESENEILAGTCEQSDVEGNVGVGPSADVNQSIERAMGTLIYNYWKFKLKKCWSLPQMRRIDQRQL